MQTESVTDDRQRLRELAEAMDCLTEDEHLLLSGWAPETAKAKRKRGEGPPYVRHGLNYFYPRGPYAEYLKQNVRARQAVGAKGLL